MLRQTLKHQLDKPAEASDPFAGVGCRPLGALDSEASFAAAQMDSAQLPPVDPASTGVASTQELLKHLGHTIRNRVVPWEKNIVDLFTVLRSLREGDGTFLTSALEPDGSYRYTDPVHGMRTLPPWLLHMIDTAPFIRLAGVGQQTAAMTERGQGISYSRCTHSIGAAILAMDAAERLGFDEGEKRLVTALALYHDARHAPFSHIFDHEIIFGKVFDHDERAIDFLRAPDVASAFSHVGLASDEIASILKDPNATPYGYLAKVLLDRVDYVQRDAIYSGLFDEHETTIIKKAANSLLENVIFDRTRNRIVFAADSVEVLEEFVTCRSETFRRTAFDPATQACNAYLRRGLDRVKRNFPSEQVAQVFLETSTYMLDDELLSYFSDREQEMLRRGGFERNIASLVVIRADDMTPKGMAELRVKHMHETLPFICGGRFYRDFDPLVVRVPRIPPSMSFTVRDTDLSTRVIEINPSTQTSLNSEYGYREIRICCNRGDPTELKHGQERIINWFKKMGYITEAAQPAVGVDDLLRPR
ncbi:MAG: hypothetical protein RL417_2346 [Pseudomonadota bacterium]|jgi:HD superfamily phosphohydrolase